MVRFDDKLQVFILPPYLFEESRDSREFYTKQFEKGYRSQNICYDMRKFEFLRDKSVVIYAGGPGDWADALRKLDAKVIYSDLTLPIAKYAHRTKDLDVVLADVMMLPFNLTEIDYLFSYQPSITSSPSQTILMILQGLTTRKGIILVDPLLWDTDAWEEPLHELYGCSMRKVNISESPISHYYYEVENSSKCSKLAFLDLELIRIVNSLRKSRLKTSSLNKLFRKMGIEQERGLESIKRIDRMMGPLVFIRDYKWIEVENF